jgi:hypothetical protein
MGNEAQNPASASRNAAWGRHAPWDTGGRGCRFSVQTFRRGARLARPTAPVPELAPPPASASDATCRFSAPPQPSREYSARARDRGRSPKGRPLVSLCSGRGLAARKCAGRPRKASEGAERGAREHAGGGLLTELGSLAVRKVIIKLIVCTQTHSREKDTVTA